jgi:hypothetical protein
MKDLVSQICNSLFGYSFTKSTLDSLVISGMPSLLHERRENFAFMPSKMANSEEMDSDRFWTKMKRNATKSIIWELVSAISGQKPEKERPKLKRARGIQ